MPSAETSDNYGRTCGTAAKKQGVTTPQAWFSRCACAGRRKAGKEIVNSADLILRITRYKQGEFAMQEPLSAKNPFGENRYGFLWETLYHCNKGRHLDYGTHDGSVIIKLAESGVIREGVGVDANVSAINSAKNIPEHVLLLPIAKGSRLPFEDESFDTVSILDVLEHIYDQQSVLSELNRVLKPCGKIIITVPQKHIFSFLDIGNFKFIFPRLHRAVFQMKHTREEYRKRYVTCENKLFGDIEQEKMWHQHFSRKELSVILKNNGFMTVKFDGTGLFTRPLLLISLAFPLIKPVIKRLIKIDYKFFARMNLFCVAEKQS